MSFVAVPPSPASPPASIVPGDGWWPEIDCNALRETLQLGTPVTHARLVGAIEGGLLTIEGQLSAWRATHEADGMASLAAIEPERKIGSRHRLTVLWTRAVTFATAAELLDQPPDTSATGEAQNRAGNQYLTAADYHKRATQAVRDILGVSRVAVDLI